MKNETSSKTDALSIPDEKGYGEGAVEAQIFDFNTGEPDDLDELSLALREDAMENPLARNFTSR